MCVHGESQWVIHGASTWRGDGRAQADTRTLGEPFSVSVSILESEK